MEMDEFEAPDQFEFDLSDVAAFESVATEEQEQQISNQQQQLQQQLEQQQQPQDEEQQQQQLHQSGDQVQDDQQQQQPQVSGSTPGSPPPPPQTLASLQPPSHSSEQQSLQQTSQSEQQTQSTQRTTIQIPSQVLQQQQQQYVTGKILLIPINSKPGQHGVKHYLQLPAGTSPLAAMTSSASSHSHKKQDTAIVERSKDSSSYSYSYPYSVASSTPATPAPPASTPPTIPVTATPSSVATPSAQVPSSKRKPCNCTKSQCLKLYCDCFANGEFCSGCNCTNCSNSLPKEKERQKAILQCLERNPEAFRPKIGKAVRSSIERRHTKGCNCKRSGCLKNYCECYEAKILCSNLCKCCGCKNYDESFERKSLMQLANSATDNARGILKNLLPTNHTNHFGTGKDTSTKNCFINDKIIRASLTCLLQSAQRAEKDGIAEDDIQNLLQIEMGKCLKMIVDSASEPAPSPPKKR